MINIILEESDIAIEIAFNEGYKEGLLFALPKAKYWEEKAIQYEKRNKTEKIIAIVSSFGAGFLTGGAGGFFVGMKF